MDVKDSKVLLPVIEPRAEASQMQTPNYSRGGLKQGGTGIGQKDMRSISDVDLAGKLISERSGAVG